MALTSSFNFTNTSATAHKAVGLFDMGELTNYGLERDEPEEVVLTNTTTAIDKGEVITYQSRKTKGVSTTLDLSYRNPIAAGVQYGVKVEAVLTTTDSSDATYRVDDPVVCTISFRHPKSSNISQANVATMLARAISALQKEDGTWRIAELMRSANKPSVE
jgi:hypothetical protein